MTQARLEKKMLQKELLAKLQVAGIDISLDSLSQLEGKRRPVFDFELFTIAKILGKEIGWFFEEEDSNER